MTARSRRRKLDRKHETPAHEVITTKKEDNGTATYVRTPCSCAKGKHHFND